MKTVQHLQQLEAALEQPSFAKAKREWGGADVVITSKRPAATDGANSFYPDPRYVVTDHALELSWLFEKLFTAFYADNLLDGCTKIEFCGRLANAANRCLAKPPAGSARPLLAAVMHEAFCIYEEIQDGSFAYLTVAVGNAIADDFIEDAERHGYLGVEETTMYFRKRGVEFP